MGNTVQATVRGPENYFDGEMHEPGEVVWVDEDLVSDEDFLEEEVELTLDQPILVDGKLQRTFTETVKVRTRFRPLGSDATVSRPDGPPAVGGQDLDRLNVTDFLKGGTDDIIKSITDGNVDDHLGAIEQGELARRGPARKAVQEAIAARLKAKAG